MLCLQFIFEHKKKLEKNYQSIGKIGKIDFETKSKNLCNISVIQNVDDIMEKQSAKIELRSMLCGCYSYYVTGIPWILLSCMQLNTKSKTASL